MRGANKDRMAVKLYRHIRNLYKTLISLTENLPDRRISGHKKTRRASQPGGFSKSQNAGYTRRSLRIFLSRNKVNTGPDTA